MRDDFTNYIVEVEPIIKYLREKGLSQQQRKFYFEDIGFRLDEIGEMVEQYTPDLVDTFASTGGESVHFGINRKTGKVNITIPCGNITNFTIADSFEDFIQIWSKYGFFPLEQIAYDITDILYYYDGYELDFDGNKIELELLPHEQKLLQELRQIYNYDIKEVGNIKKYLYKINDGNKEVIDFFDSSEGGVK